MSQQITMQVGCDLIAEFTDEGEEPQNPDFHLGTAVPTRVVSFEQEFATVVDRSLEFTIILRDSFSESHPTRTVKVRGYGLRQIASGQDGTKGWVGVLGPKASEDVYLALFPASVILASFCTEIESVSPV